jgi:hypothetical protein
MQTLVFTYKTQLTFFAAATASWSEPLRCRSPSALHFNNSEPLTILQHRVFCLGYSIKCAAFRALSLHHHANNLFAFSRRTPTHSSIIQPFFPRFFREPSFPAALDVRAAKNLGVPKVLRCKTLYCDTQLNHHRICGVFFSRRICVVFRVLCCGG